jgi:3-dehydroquinate synthetase
MRFALALSQIRKKISPKKREALDRFLSRLDVPALPQSFGPEQFYEVMTKDKKVRGGKIHFVLLKDIGKTVSDSGVTPDDVARAFELVRKGRS